ncbi:hypothetical protein K505DRAFT_359363 [Melanomma pulvis-pyrius CBS 109.77]|uniref:Uncharacterized protein n=1 Tax=Melanomma pulvis-pyrius CBS 109.77 TaxID=1314802 RepID=A0A6A6XJQ7_9PLEO|nr:hypothetical protein K505DRAFT_359363 [Melanomma pulvis-pyrius CBS 109.77]
MIPVRIPSNQAPPLPDYSSSKIVEVSQQPLLFTDPKKLTYQTLHSHTASSIQLGLHISGPHVSHFTPPHPRPHRRFRPRREHGATNNSRGSGELGAALERINGYIKEFPKAAREVSAKLRTRRARQKLAWLKKHNFLSEQERYLT